MKSNRRPPTRMSMPLSLSWSHGGAMHRVTPWPDVQFERVCADGWIAVVPTDEALAAAGSELHLADWEPYLEFLPGEVRDFIRSFGRNRMPVLQIVARCPALLTALAETPALTAFLAAHAGLRGTSGPRWNEINAVNERCGIFGVLEWLGLPASRQALAGLQAVSDPEISRENLELLRTELWERRVIPTLLPLAPSDRRALSQPRHALAA